MADGISNEGWLRLRATGDPRLREEAIVAHVPLVRYVAMRMKMGLPAHVEVEDLASYGIVGLIAAVDRFDPKRGVRFETYAIPRIKGSILDELRTQDWAPKSVRASTRAIDSAVERLTVRHHRPPTDEEVADLLEIDVSDVHSARADAACARIESLAHTLESGEPTHAPADVRESDHSTSAEWGRARDLLAEALAGLDREQQAVVALHYGQRMKLREVGDALGFGAGKATRLYADACLLIRERLALLT